MTGKNRGVVDEAEEGRRVEVVEGRRRVEEGEREDTPDPELSQGYLAAGCCNISTKRVAIHRFLQYISR